MRGVVYDIFLGTSEQDALWLEAVEGLSRAKERLSQIAAHKPGNYFIFSSQAQAIIARLRASQAPGSWSDETIDPASQQQ